MYDGEDSPTDQMGPAQAMSPPHHMSPPLSFEPSTFPDPALTLINNSIYNVIIYKHSYINIFIKI